MPAPPAGTIDFDAIRAATQKYADVKVALAEGYILPMAICVNATMEGQPAQLGAMGLHYIRPDLLGIAEVAPRVNGTGTHTDFLQPGVLVYEPQADGSEKLVAIENLVWAKAWKEAGNTAAPSFHGQEYYYMHDNAATEVDEAHGFEPHYELHMWLYKENPAGIFSPFNTATTCANYQSQPSHQGH
ncbi:MAG: hypothetical protein KY466_07495 [Gemmatimonadetes bacterium]|nr:hypothetical protein [Gemmatimonadota bacterium]